VTSNIQRHARIVGALYVVLFVLGPFAFLLGKAAALVPDDAAATARNILALDGQFRVGLAIEGVIFLIEVLLAAILYVMFRPVHPAASLASAFARLGEAVVQAANLLPSALLLFVLTEPVYRAAFTPAQLEALAHLFLNANAFMILVWGLFFGLHLVLLGALVHASGFLPRWLGILLMVAGPGYLLQSVGTILRPSASEALDTLVVVMAVPGELAFALWLLVKGVDRDRWAARAAAA
jgi:hypothetical protein